MPDVNPFIERPRSLVKDMSRNRRNLPRDETARIVHSHAPESDASSWLRALRAIRELPEVVA
jgi:hypothetical protein